MIINNTQEIIKSINSGKSFAIVTHVNPDGDCIGSGLSLYKALKLLNKQVDIFCDDIISKNLIEIKGHEAVSYNLIDGKYYDTVIAVDCSEINRTGKFGVLFDEKKSITIAIDHHVSHIKFTKYALVDEDAAATCEILYFVLKKMNLIDDDIAETLFSGLVTDSGCFCFSNTTKQTMQVATELFSYRFDASNLIYRIFKKVSLPVFKMRNEVLSGAYFTSNGRIAIAELSIEILQKYNLDKSSSEGLSNMLLDIDVIDIAIVMLQVSKNLYKISIRSKAPVHAVEVAKAFGGGGHNLAAGCQIAGNKYDVKDKLERFALIELERADLNR